MHFISGILNYKYSKLKSSDEKFLTNFKRMAFKKKNNKSHIVHQLIHVQVTLLITESVENSVNEESINFESALYSLHVTIHVLFFGAEYV